MVFVDDESANHDKCAGFQKLESGSVHPSNDEVVDLSDPELLIRTRQDPRKSVGGMLGRQLISQLSRQSGDL
jgi:hypothetical protein